MSKDRLNIECLKRSMRDYYSNDLQQALIDIKEVANYNWPGVNSDSKVVIEIRKIILELEEYMGRDE